MAALVLGVALLLQEAPATQPQTLVTAQRGTLPILISAPHGGTRRIEGVPDRNGKGVSRKRGAKTNFSFALDRSTDTLALALAEALEKLTGERPYLVVAHFSRRQIDANRSVEEGVESPAARAVYEQYHEALRDYRSEILAKFGGGILIDLHGHGGDPETLYRGTADGQTVRNLRETFGLEALVGAEGLFGPLEASGIKVVPSGASTDRENPALNGGFIVRTYGSFAGGSFDAVQMELGSALRAPERLPSLADQLAAALSTYHKRYLTPQEDDYGKSGPTSRPSDRSDAGAETPNIQKP